MGTDVYSEQGIIASTDDMISLIRKKDLKNVISVCKDDTLEIDELKPLKKISATTTLEELKSILSDCVVVHGEPQKYGSDDCYLENEYQLHVLWGEIIGKTRPELPTLTQISLFDSPRYNGWDVPLGEACFIFDSSDCFIKSLSDEGRALKKAIGHCNTTEWTIVSY